VMITEEHRLRRDYTIVYWSKERGEVEMCRFKGAGEDQETAYVEMIFVELY
jgi:hypothetical protein